MGSSIPLSEYASKLEEHVKQRYLQKISSIGVDPALIEGKHFKPINPIVYHQWNQSTFYFTWFWKLASTRNNNLKPSAAFRATRRVWKFHATRLEISRHAFGNFAPRVWKFHATRLEISRHAFGNFAPRVWKFHATRTHIVVGRESTGSVYSLHKHGG